MGRRTRPDFARSSLACALVFVFCAVSVAGCGGNSYVSYSSGGTGSTGTPSGTGFTAYANSSSGGYFMLGMIALLGFHWEAWEESLRRNGMAPAYVPPMDPARGVNLQDCTKPIENSSANLQCR